MIQYLNSLVFGVFAQPCVICRLQDGMTAPSNEKSRWPAMRPIGVDAIGEATKNPTSTR